MKLVNATIITPNKVIEKGVIEIDSQRIKKIKTDQSDIGVDCKGYRVFPGFIDMHVHGTNQADFMDASTESIETILSNLPKEGTTSLLATTMTESIENIEKALIALANMKEYSGSRLLGVHLEGPFINSDYQGAQNINHIKQGTIDLYERFKKASNNMIKLITLAPEIQTDEFINHIINDGVILSMGHSSASHDEVVKARELGIKRVTHCYNAMRHLHHREIGLTGAALLYDDINIELIADLKHVSKPALELAYKLKKNTIQLVSDSIRGKNMPDGMYDLGGQTVHVKNQLPYTEKGVIAGSTLALNKAAKHMFDITKDNVILSHMLSTHQAQELGINHELGSIEEGLMADLVIVDQDFNVMMTIIKGEIIYQSEAFS